MCSIFSNIWWAQRCCCNLSWIGVDWLLPFPCRIKHPAHTAKEKALCLNFPRTPSFCSAVDACAPCSWPPPSPDVQLLLALSPLPPCLLRALAPARPEPADACLLCAQAEGAPCSWAACCCLPLKSALLASCLWGAPLHNELCPLPCRCLLWMAAHACLCWTLWKDYHSAL